MAIIPMDQQDQKLKYLQLLSQQFPNSQEAAKEVVLLNAILSLTKGAEVFLSDVHGEYEAFEHLVRNGSGVIKQKIQELYGDSWSKEEINRLASIIYYPEEKLKLLVAAIDHPDKFYKQTIRAMTAVTREFAGIYAMRKLQKLLPAGYGDVIMELVNRLETGDTKDYSDYLLKSVIETGQAERLIAELAAFIQRLSIHKIHIIGDIYDRGPGAEIIIDQLMNHHAVDVQWGNHDIVWMGAACGSEACMANVLRLSLRYGNTDTLETGYGIHLMPLASFALEHYKDDKSIVFDPKVLPGDLFNESEQWLNRIMHKAITLIQFKLEGQLIQRRSEFGLDDRLLLDKINFETGTIRVGDQDYQLNDTFFPTIDPEDPFELSGPEKLLMERIGDSFLHSERLQRHVRFMFEKGGLYKITNNNLLYHGCIPLTAEGQLREVDLGKGAFKGRALLDFFDRQMTIAQSGVSGSDSKSYAIDLMWYMWAGPDSPIFGKDKMATFERYFLQDKEPQREVKDYYYQYRDDPATCEMILAEFGLSAEHAVILNGHVPVSVKKGENPVKADGKLVVIDGGFSKAYQAQTGIAGYTLIHNAKGRQLIAHEPFESRKKAIEEEIDIAFNQTILYQSESRLKVGDMPDGQRIVQSISDLQDLIKCFQEGSIRERF